MASTSFGTGQRQNVATKMKRVKVNPRCANPLFVKWLEEWKTEASTRGSEMHHCFSKALTTMKKCPIRLNRGRDCMVLKNFGQKLCQMLDKKLSDYEANGGWDNDKEDDDSGSADPMIIERQNDFNAVNVNRNLSIEKTAAKTSGADGGERLKSRDEEPPVKKVKTPKAKGNKNNVKGTLAVDDARGENHNTRSYIPAWRSGGYAILLALYDKTFDPEDVGYMGKADLQTVAQKYCDKSFKKPELGNRYTAWSSMSILIEKGLVIKKSSPAKYKLTDAGFAVAVQLHEVTVKDKEESEVVASGFRSEINRFQSASKGLKSPPIFTRDNKIYNSLCSSSKSLSSISTPSYNWEEFPCLEIGDDDNDDDGGKKVEKVIVKENISDKRGKVFKNVGDPLGPKNGSQESDNSASYDYSIILAPQSFDVILIIDDRETAGGKTRPKDDATIAELTKTGIKFEVKNLKIGDFVWVARSRISGEELVLPYVVERKRIDDFSSSIKDGRYYEQKFRLKRSGLQNVTYLVENHGTNQYSTLPINSLFQAAMNTLVQDGFTVKWTNCHKDSMIYLASMTQMLSKIYQEKTLLASKKENLTISDVNNNFAQLMHFEEFNKAAAKVKTFKSKEMFIRQLIQLRGVSVQKAFAIVDFYPTPLALKKAFDNAGEQGENLLAGIQIGLTKHHFGPALSKTLHQFYTRKDF